MSNPTSNFGWQMPTATDLVTDLPADFEVFGQAVDTDFADLNGGTTGQILSKTSATDLDFTWINNDQGDITGVTAGTGISGGGTSGTVTVTNTMATAIDAKGDLIAGTGADAFSRLAVGATNGHVLTVDSAEATGMRWGAAAAGGKVLQVVSATSTTNVNITTDTLTDSGVTATITPTSNTSKILVIMTPTQQLFRLTVDANVLIGGCVLRGATKILDYDVVGTGYQGGIEVGTTSTVVRLNQHPAFTILDAPATTSATTYKLQARAVSGSTSFQVNGAPSVITLLEIGA